MRIKKNLTVQNKANKTVVLIEEEFGFRMWLLIANLNNNQFEQYWKDLQHIDKFNFFKLFSEIGVLYNITENNLYNKIESLRGKIYSAHIFDDCDSCLIQPNCLGGKVITHSFYDEANRLLDAELLEQ